MTEEPKTYTPPTSAGSNSLSSRLGGHFSATAETTRGLDAVESARVQAFMNNLRDQAAWEDVVWDEPKPKA